MQSYFIFLIHCYLFLWPISQFCSLSLSVNEVTYLKNLERSVREVFRKLTKSPGYVGKSWQRKLLIADFVWSCARV